MSHQAAEKFIKRYEGTDAYLLLQSLFHDCLLRDLRPKTTKSYCERLHYLLVHLRSKGLGIFDVTKQVMQDYILFLNGKVSVATINGRIRAYKRFWTHIIEEELWSNPNPMKSIRQLKQSRRVKNVIGPDEVIKMLRMLNRKSFFGNRESIAILLSWDCMCRSGELRNLKIGDIDIAKRLMKISGKTGERIVPLSIRTAKALSSYLVKWRSKFPGEYLLCMTNGSKLSERRYHRCIKGTAEKAGVDVTPHGLRHSAATWYASQPGASLEMLRILLGHSSLAITQVYLHITPSDMVSGYDILAPGNVIRF